MNPITKIGCEAYILRNNQLLLGKRSMKIAGGGNWALPGGHLEFMERVDDCIIREAQEELGITLKHSDIKLLAITDDANQEDTNHYIHFCFQVDIGTQEPKLMEPDACDEWKFFDLNNLPQPFSPYHSKILETIKSGNIYKYATD